jgi:ABC-type sugar transport system ATPase subunit
VRDGIVHISENREFAGLFASLSVARNIHRGLLGKVGSAFGKVWPARAKAVRVNRRGAPRSCRC